MQFALRASFEYMYIYWNNITYLECIILFYIQNVLLYTWWSASLVHFRVCKWPVAPGAGSGGTETRRSRYEPVQPWASVDRWRRAGPSEVLKNIVVK